MKPGYQTTEFWLTVLSSVWGVVGATASPVLQVVIPAVLTGAYAVARGLAKLNGKPSAE